ncbi:hypothetical protein WMF26_10220 [Sorangium sp. So ce185]|uniref:hypothetical protein n=1 Tax=Sorangium sp. So ce185 TaxID=3133287 RepID=UPI003F627391
MTAPPRRRAPLALASACALAGCSSAPAQPSRPAAAVLPPADIAGAAYASPARWSYHPAPPEAAVAWAPSTGGGCVVVAQGGQRWTVTPESRAAAAARPDAAAPPGAAAQPVRCAGQGRASAAPAPEELTAIVRRSPASWMFVGASGSIYEASSPLGPFTRTLSPPEPLVQLAGAGGSLLGVTRAGGVLRWREELGWKPTLLDGAAAQAGSPPRAFGVAMTEGGRALALALPEALFASEDGGATWARAPLPAMGLSRVGVLGGELLAEGLLASATWDPRRAPAFSRGAATLPRADVELAIAAPRAPSAAAVWLGRAAIAGDRYVEAVRPDDAGAPWRLASGPIDGPLKEAPLPGTGECGSIKLGANGRRVVAVCAEPDGDRIVARVLRSEDGGGAWSPAATLETADIDQVGVAVAPEGAALVTGVCRPSDGADGCKPTAPLLLTRDGARDARDAVTLAAAPTLSAPAALPAFSADGRSAYFLGYRGKDERLALFVSHDGGETFAPRSLDATGGAPPAARGDGAEDEDEDAEGGPGEGASPEGLEIVEESALRPADDGAVGLLLSDRGALTYLTADEDGRVLTAAAAPAESAALAGFGRRVVALSARASRGRAHTDGGGEDVAAFWESLDGGVTWVELPEMPALSRELAQAPVAVACGASGCLFGDVATRVGWGGQAEAAPPRAPEPPPRAQPAVRTPIVCETLPSSKWTRIDHVDASGLGLPDADELLRGRSVWSLLTRAPSGAIDVVSATLPESGAGEARVVTRSLLPAVPAGLGGARVATNLTAQMEGYAAARVRIPGGAAKPGAPMRNVEVAWENWLDGTSGRGVIPDAGPFELGDVKPAADAARNAPPGARPQPGQRRTPAPPPEDFYDPALLSVSLRGIFLRPHSGSAHSELTFFYEPSGKLQRFDFPSWPASGLHGSLDVRADAVLADGQPVGVGMVRQASNGPVTAMLLAHRPAPAPSAGAPAPPGSGPAWAIEAVTVAPPAGRDRLVHTDWTYAGTSIGVTTLVADPGHAIAWALFQPFRKDGTLGAARPLPTPFDLGDAPRPCSAAERAATARHEVPLFLGSEALFPGTRHPVVVTDAAGPSGAPEVMVLLTASTVLHGTPSAPCVAGWDARAIGRAPLSAILPGDLAQSWLFRAAAGSSGATGTAIELRRMACRFEPSAKVPEAVWSEPALDGSPRPER